jgi:hypothetical protein
MASHLSKREVEALIISHTPGKSTVTKVTYLWKCSGNTSN